MAGQTLHHRLHALIGERFLYLDEIWILIEILSDTDAVVLQRCLDCQPGRVQQNAYGIPNRRAQDTLTLPISDSSGDAYSDDLLLILEGRQDPHGSR
jgi:hypothetical protein